MIEKIMKAVKSNNKKRGRNITVGAVVGMLLSCTAVMGADEYLWIKEDGGVIKFINDITMPASTENPYGKNTWDRGDYINNIMLNSTSTNYGLKLEGDLGSVNFTNNGLIGSTETSTSYGIYNGSGSKIGNIINTGSIIGTNTGSSEGHGISNNNGTMGDITNTGLITGTSTGSGKGYGIYNVGTMGDIINTGLIAGMGRDSYGIFLPGWAVEISSINNVE